MSAQANVNINVNTGDSVAELGQLEASLEAQERKLAAFQGGIDIVGGSVESLVGGLALLGVENEYIQNLEQGAVGAIAFADGIKRFGDGVVTLTKNTRIGAAAQRAFNAVTLSNPYVAAATAIIALTTAVIAYVAVVNREKTAIEDKNKAREREIELANESLQQYADQTADEAFLNGIRRQKNEKTLQTIIKLRQAKVDEAIEAKKQAEDEIRRQGLITAVTTKAKQEQNDIIRKNRRIINDSNAVLEQEGKIVEVAVSRLDELKKAREGVTKTTTEDEGEGVVDKVNEAYNAQIKNLEVLARRENELAIARGDSDEVINARIDDQLQAQLALAKTIEDKALRETELARIQAAIDEQNHKKILQSLDDETKKRVENAEEAAKLIDDLNKEEGTEAEKFQREQDIRLAILTEALENESITREQYERAKQQLAQDSAEFQIAQEQTIKEAKTQLLIDSLSEFQGLVDVFNQAGLERLDARMDSVTAQYEREIASAGDNREKIEEITKRRDEELARIEAERQRRENQALIFQQTIELAKLTASASTALSQMAIDGAQAGADVSKGFASTLKAGFPGNVPLLIAYAAQAAAVIASITKARRQAKQAINSQVPGGGGGGGGGLNSPTPQLPNITAPEGLDREAAFFASQDNEPIQAYVLASDVNDGLEARQRIQSRRTL